VVEMSGIYIITCSKRPGGYVGKTSRPFDRRWAEHKQDLLSGNHQNDALQGLVNSFATRDRGVKALRFKELEQCDRSDLAMRELVWIAKSGTWNECPTQAQAKRQLSAAKPEKGKRSEPLFPWWVQLGAAIAAGLLGWSRAGLVGAVIGVGLVVVVLGGF
jgi:predicted GIY-YIG superfamily endonuclease